MMRLKTTAQLVPVLALVLGVTGCATKGYVRNELDALHQQINDNDAQLSASIQETQNSADQALARAESAYGEAGTARGLALGNMGFEEVKQYTILFNFDSAELTPDAQATLKAAALTIREHQEYLVDIYGFTDTVGSAAYNLALGQRRANSVMRSLVDMAPGQLSRFAAVSYGEEKPAGDNASSRRVVVSLITRTEPKKDMSNLAE
jgi:outer membrane protein OmpA-like peptidoglycan-associated protein